MAELYALLKAVPGAIALINKFVDAWDLHRLGQINTHYEQRSEEREAIIWAMEQARLARDVNKLRALNRQLATLDGGGVLPDSGPVQ